MKNFFKKSLYLIAIVFLTMNFASLGFAQEVDPREKLDTIGEGIGLEGSFPKFVGDIILAILGVVAIVFLIIVIYAGFIWLLAQGDPGKIGKAKLMLTWSVIGVVVMFLSYSIAYFLINSIVLQQPV